MPNIYTKEGLPSKSALKKGYIFSKHNKTLFLSYKGSDFHIEQFKDSCRTKWIIEHSFKETIILWKQM